MYNRLIRQTAARLGYVGENPRWIEAWMRLEHPTLDGLSRDQFQDEVEIAVQCIRTATREENESLAHSYGLGPHDFQA